MADVLKVLSTEISLSNSVANSVSSASLVRLVNTHPTTSEVVQLCHANGDVKATTTVGHTITDSARLILVKQPTEVLKTTGLATVKATSIAYI
jgi:hypothetical protein